MISAHLARPRTRGLLAAFASSTLVLAGCSTSMAPVGSSAITPQAAVVKGSVHGGNQPVAGATVTLYRAGQNGFATGGTAIAHTTSSTDGFGSFGFSEVASSTNSNADNTFSCPTTGPDVNGYLYVVARGGTTVGTANAVPNPDAVFIAPMGPCNSVTTSTFISMSEVVTVATMAAIHQFMNPSTTPIETTVGSDGVFVSTQAFINAFAGVSNMVSLANGMGQAPFTKTGSTVNGSVGVVVTVTPELAKINQLANAISSCINYSGSGNPNCTTIYNNATPPASAASTSVPGATYPTPTTDLLTALYYIFTNPVSGGTAQRQSIYDLSAAAGAPYQPTLSALPTDWSIGVAYSSNSNCTDINGSTAGFINTPYSLEIDRFGDIWIGNNQAGAGSLGHLQADGQPTSCTTLTANNSPIPVAAGTASTTVDTNGNIYSGLIRSNDLYRFTPSNSSLSAPIDIPTAGPVQALAADGSGNVFYATTAGNLYEIANAATASSFSLSSSVQINTISVGSPTRMLVDAANRIWVSSGGNFVTYTQLSSGTYATTSVTTTSQVTDVTMGAANGGVTQVYTVNPATNAVQNFSITAANATTQGTALSGGGLSAPPALALDGAGNIWVANNTLNSVTGFTAAGASLTATTGLTKSSTYFSGSHGITVDAGGNIWVATGTNTVTEIVGTAVPVYKSYAIALQTGRFQTLP